MMKKEIRLLGIAALVAVIGLSVTACGEDDPPVIPGSSRETALAVGPGTHGPISIGSRDERHWFIVTGTGGRVVIEPVISFV